MRAYYNFQHILLRDMVLNYDSNLLSRIIEGKNKFGATLIIDTAIEKAHLSDFVSYKIEFIKVGNLNALKYRFTTSAMPISITDCAYIIILVKEQNYYFTAEYTIGQNQIALCSWDDKAHYNYGSYPNNDDELIITKIEEIIGESCESKAVAINTAVNKPLEEQNKEINKMIIHKTFGLDLGTTNSTPSVFINGASFCPEDGKLKTIPSLVAKKGDKFIVGVAPKNNPHIEKIRSIKRMMGKEEPAVLNGQNYSPEEISAEIVRYCAEILNKQVEKTENVVYDRIVITVPAYFSIAQKDATRKAGELAGLEVLMLLEEPTAAAINYTVKNNVNSGVFMVYDLGGGTFDVSIIEKIENIPVVLATAGNNFLGGDNFDNLLARYFIDVLNIYTSFKFFCGKLTDNAENNEAYLFEHFPKLIERLKPSDIGALFEGFASCCFQLVKLENIENNTYDKISKTAETARQLLPLIDEDDIEEGKLDIVKILIGLADNGEEWYSTYQTHIKNIVNKTKLSESLYEVCYMIYHASSLKEYRIAFSNLLSDVSGFNTELVVMIQKKERLESVCESTKDKGKYILYSTIKSQIGDEIPTPKDIDNFILNYYALSIINSELKQFFKNIQQMVFTPLMMLDNVPTYSFGYGGLTPKGEFMKDLFMELPNDWEIDLGGTKIVVRDFLRSKLNCYSGSNYGNSKSKTYMIKCDNAISARKTPSATTSKSATTTTTTSSTTRSYAPSTSSSGTNGKVVCGVLSAIAFLIMIICFACEAPVGGVIFLIGAVALLIGAAKYDDIKDNGKALTAIILIPIILCCIFGPIVGNVNSSSSSSSSSGSSGGGGYNNNSEYTVTLNKDGGYGGTSTVYVEYGDSMPYATAPTKSGYEFGGYYTSRNGVGTQYYTASMSSARKWNKSSNTTLYAYWIEEDDSIALTENNFESYFNFTSSCSVSRYDYGSSGTATYSFSISPKSSFNHYNYDNPSSITVTIGLDISSISTSYGKPSEYKITVTLYKSSGYSYSGSRSYSVGAYENYWIDGIYDVDAKIYN